MATSKPLLLFDSIETIFSLDPLGDRLKEAGLPDNALPLFFAQLLRDAFAISATGQFQPFGGVASGTLEVLLANHGIEPDANQCNEILEAFGELHPHADVQKAFDRAHEREAQVVLLTNGTLRNTEQLVERGDLKDSVDGIVSISEFELWKPAQTVYLRAAERYGHAAEETGMIAAHAWDLQGALAAGLQAGWIQRQDALYHPAMRQPQVQGEELTDVVDRLLDSLEAD